MKRSLEIQQFQAPSQGSQQLRPTLLFLELTQGQVAFIQLVVHTGTLPIRSVDSSHTGAQSLLCRGNIGVQARGDRSESRRPDRRSLVVASHMDIASGDIGKNLHTDMALTRDPTYCDNLINLDTTRFEAFENSPGS